MARFEVTDLSVGYDAPLLTGVTFDAGAGEVLGILGRNGSGKTTLLRGVAGSIRRFAGYICIDGADCTFLTPRQQATRMTVLPQQTEVLPGLIARDLIAMGRYPYGSLFSDASREDAARITQAAASLGIAHLLDADCIKLSQGQRQLVLLARCMVQDTPVLLLDEPNAALDYDNTHAMFAAVRHLAKHQGKTALLVLHDPELALRYCDRLLILHEGCLCADVPVAGVSEETLQQALRRLYPHMTLRKDPYDGHFRCYDRQSEEEPC